MNESRCLDNLTAIRVLSASVHDAIAGRPYHMFVVITKRMLYKIRTTSHEEPTIGIGRAGKVVAGA